MICTSFGKGRQHDFSLFKASKTRCLPATNILVDSAYQGLESLHKKTELPKKRGRKKALSKVDKCSNQDLSSRRTLVENVIGSLKRFRILSERYRNRRKRFGLRFNLITAIHNFEL